MNRSNLFCSYFLVLLTLIFSCDNGDGPGTFSGGGTGIGPGNGTIPGNSTWSIPSNQVFDGGPGKDGIPALVNPAMVSSVQANYLTDNDLVIGFKVGDDVRAYPHQILDWHEIINDVVGEQPLAITYCPLTGTGIGWNRVISGNTTTFGVSGLLFNTNLIPYDRSTDSNWSQMKLECVNGQLIGEIRYSSQQKLPQFLNRDRVVILIILDYFILFILTNNTFQ